MGDGAWSAGGYEIAYDEYDYNESNGYSVWTMQGGSSISIDEMSNRHIKNTIRLCERLSIEANFSCESEKWDDWVNVLTDELTDRELKGIVIKDAGSAKTANRGKQSKASKKQAKNYQSVDFTSNKAEMKCHCGCVYKARVADLKRGWGISCSKRCAAIRRDYGKKPAKFIKCI